MASIWASWLRTTATDSDIDEIERHRNKLMSDKEVLLEACKEALKMYEGQEMADCRCVSGYGYVEVALMKAIAKAEKP